MGSKRRRRLWRLSQQIEADAQRQMPKVAWRWSWRKARRWLAGVGRVQARLLHLGMVNPRLLDRPCRSTRQCR